MCRSESGRFAMALLLAAIASASAGGADPLIVVVDLQLSGMRGLTADWQSGDLQRVHRDLVDLLRGSPRLRPWSFGFPEGEAPYRLSFEVENTKSEQIHIYVRLLVAGEEKEEVDLSPVEARDHVDELLLLEPEDVAGWLEDRLRTSDLRGRENRGRLSRLLARLKEYVPIAQGGRWLSREECLHIELPLTESGEECLHIHLPVAESRHRDLGYEHFCLECFRQRHKAREWSHIYAYGTNIWMPYDPRVRESHLIVTPTELLSAGIRCHPEEKPAKEVRQHTPKTVYLCSYAFGHHGPMRIP